MNIQTMPSATAIDDRRVATATVIDDRRVAARNRRAEPRIKTLLGAKILWSSGEAVECIVRNLSPRGAKIEVHSPVPDNFTLVFDRNKADRACTVMWRRPSGVGVRFD